MNIIGVIPARMASSRLPGKMLLDIGGKSLIHRTWEQARQAASLSQVLIATDHGDILEEAARIGAHAVITDVAHPSGTDRCHEAIRSLGLRPDFIINIQGDEPFLSPATIDGLSAILKKETELATLVQALHEEEDLHNPNVVKVVKDIYGQALYFSRSAIPYQREVQQAKPAYWRHIGMYAYRWDVLQKITLLPPSSYEQAESLEQLRWLENGFRIQTAEVKGSHFGIDTLADLEKARNLVQQKNFPSHD